MAMPQFTTLGAELRRRPTRERSISPHAAAAVPAAAAPVQGQPDARPARSSRRATSYHNAFQTSCAVSNDAPPSYAIAVRTPVRSSPAAAEGRETLPAYSCTVGMEGKLLLNLESTNPLHGSCQGEWREVYVIVRGTMVSFHRVTSAGAAGRLFRSYTLQHAEVGLASDVEHTILLPQTRFAHLIPSSARRRAWQKDPDLFQPVPQHILRLRIETDQIILADACEERIWDLIHILSAAIDLSPPIDERSIPKQCTVPRRRRRPRPQNATDASDAALLAEQERIFRQMYPDFATPASVRPGNPRTETPNPNAPLPGREDDEVDISAMREEPAPPSNSYFALHPDGATLLRPENVRQTTSNTIHSVLSVDMIHSTPTTNFNEEGKWQPPHTRTPAQSQRYVRRCMPTLTADAARASDVLIAQGRRMRLNWRMELLEPWELQPPAYKAHDFSAQGTHLARATSQRSSLASAGHSEPQSSSSMIGDCDHIMPLDHSMDMLHLTKVVSAITTTDKDAHNPRHLPTTDDESKLRRPQQTSTTDVHDVVFCF